MANIAPFKNLNFQASDSPAAIDLKTTLGDISSRITALANIGPGSLSVAASFDDGTTFETSFTVAPETIVVGLLDNVDRIEITHTGIDSGYSVFTEASVTMFSVVSFPNSKLYTVANYFSEFLLNGGSEDMAVDGSVTPVEFSYTVPTDTRVKLSQAFMTMEDGPLAFRPGDFGAISGVLTNGVEVSITPFGGVKTVMETWVTNREIRNTIFDFDTEFRTDGQYVGRWTMTSDFAGGELFLNDGDKFSVIIQDDLTPLDFMSFRLKGTLLDIS